MTVPADVPTGDGVDRRRLAAILAGIALLALVVQADLLTRVGVVRGVDTARYLDGADRLQQWEPLVGEQWLYSGYVALVAVVRAVGLGLAGVVALQVVAHLGAAAALFLVGRRAYSTAAGAAAAVLWVGSPDFTRFLGWQAYVLTDALYAASLAFVLLAAAHSRTTGRRPLIVLAAVVAVSAALRPSGWLVVAVVTAALSVRVRALPWQAVGIVLAMCFPILATVLLPSDASVIGDPAADLREGRVFRSGVGYDEWQLAMPAGDGDRSALSYVVAHPVDALRLALARVGAEAIHARPTYGTARNAVLATWAVVMWTLGLVGLVVRWRDPLVRLSAALVFAHLAVVAVTFADPDGRFLIHVLAPLAVLAAIGSVAIGRAVARLVSRRTFLPL